MAARAPNIAGLEWDDVNEEHILEHVGPWLVEEMIQYNDWVAFPNTEGHPPERVKIIGKTESGIHVTVILEPPTRHNAGYWRPITAWMSEPLERRVYEKNRKRKGCKG